MKEDPKITLGHGTFKDEEIETHPAYGQIAISRVQGNCNLYGSGIKNHGGFMTLKVYSSERHHHLNKDWYSTRKLLLEINLSQAQYATLITTPNIGEGVPCTITYHNGEMKPAINDVAETEAEKIVTVFKREQEDFVRELEEEARRCAAILDKKGPILVGERQALREMVVRTMERVKDNRPFVVEQFQRAAERTVTAAKGEVEAYTMTALAKLGLTKLSELVALSGGEPTKRIGE